jgi:hypothetical protein
MKNNNQYHHNQEHGQTLIILALVIVILFAFAALALDMGLLFMQRRNAQSAADAAALSGAFAKCQGKNPRLAARKMAAQNGFANDTKSSITDHVIVTINTPPAAGPYAGEDEYIEVLIQVTSKPIFSGFIYNGPLVETIRSVSRCTSESGGTSFSPGLGGNVSILVLNPTASQAFTNVGAAEVDVDGGVFVNSTASDAMYQNGSATLKMNWARVRGGADVGGAFGIYPNGTTEHAEVIEVVKDFRTSGAGKAISGAFSIGGSVLNTASVNMTADFMNVGGNFDNSGAASVIAPSLLIGGNIVNKGSGSFTSESMDVGGNITEDGASWIRPASGKNMSLRAGGNVTLSGSASIGQNSTDYIVVEGTVKTTGGSKINGSVTKAEVNNPGFSLAIPLFADPLATALQPPASPKGSCTTISVPNYGTHNLSLTSGTYYCSFDIGGSTVATIPPGTYWVNSFNLSGAARLVMDGVHLYITGNGASNAFSVGGSTTISMKGTMLYIKSGAFNFTGASGTLHWTAPGAGQEYPGLSLYMDRSNTSSASQTGSTTIGSMSGTWYAPASTCSFTGATNTTIYSQFICNKVTVTGSSKLIIKYDGTLVYQVGSTGSGPSVSLIE